VTADRLCAYVLAGDGVRFTDAYAAPGEVWAMHKPDGSPGGKFRPASSPQLTAPHPNM
jgi:hypothetical protein